jgi:hypothetical protein
MHLGWTQHCCRARGIILDATFGCSCCRCCRCCRVGPKCVGWVVAQRVGPKHVVGFQPQLPQHCCPRRRRRRRCCRVWVGQRDSELGGAAGPLQRLSGSRGRQRVGGGGGGGWVGGRSFAETRAALAAPTQGGTVNENEKEQKKRERERERKVC